MFPLFYVAVRKKLLLCKVFLERTLYLTLDEWNKLLFRINISNLLIIMKYLIILGYMFFRAQTSNIGANYFMGFHKSTLVVLHF